MDKLTRTFAKNLHAIRLQKKMAQKTLAQRAKISLSYVSMLERAKRSPPLATLEVVAKALSVKPAYLLQELDLEKVPRDLRSTPRAERLAR